MEDSYKTVETTFKLTYNDEMYRQATEYVEDMKKHPNRVFWIGKEGQSDEQLVLSHIAHKILSGFYNNYDPFYARQNIVAMENKQAG